MAPSVGMETGLWVEMSVDLRGGTEGDDKTEGEIVAITVY